MYLGYLITFSIFLYFTNVFATTKSFNFKRSRSLEIFSSRQLKSIFKLLNCMNIRFKQKRILK